MGFGTTCNRSNKKSDEAKAGYGEYCMAGHGIQCGNAGGLSSENRPVSTRGDFALQMLSLIHAHLKANYEDGDGS